ncbi:hypothetical protein AB0N99_30825 [Streptomyces sp. NPDC093272]|uniref:hypothetical protein n=1 Tax=Streptomyces sp. NPDC093272 TaxID=3154981 RepID=UPI0034374591
MHRRITTAALAAVTLALAGCSAGPSYNETVKQCSAALDAQYKAGGKGKPADCKGVKPDDYSVLVGDAAIRHLGWTDSDGNFDKNKMQEDTTP